MTLLATSIAAFCLLTLTASTSVNRTARSRVDATKAFYVAEGGIDFGLSQIAAQSYWPARSAADFPTVAADGSFETDWMPFGSRGGEFRLQVAYARANRVPSTWTGTGFPTGFQPLTTVAFGDRNASPAFDRILVRASGRHGGITRSVRASVKLEVTAFGGAIVADAVSVAGSGSGKGFAKDNLNVVFNGVNQYVQGGIRANGGVYVDGSSTPLTDANATAELSHFTGSVTANLYGTAEEVPDFTNPGSDEQLFDFNRFKAAADAGAGATYDGLAAFASAMNAANAAGTPLEGIIFVVVDCAAEGGSPKLMSTPGARGIPGGINVKGTLVFHFVNAPDRFYKVFIETPLRVNAAALPAGFDAADPSTYRSGYPPVLSASRDPRNVDITSAGFSNFGAGDDLPALMFDSGTVDIHHEANVCGVVYGPSFIEIENKRARRQYFNGVVIGGAGIFLEGSAGTDAEQVFVFDSSTVDALATFENRGKAPVISGYVIER